MECRFTKYNISNMAVGKHMIGIVCFTSDPVPLLTKLHS